MRFSGWTLNYPEIGHAYKLKEAFFEIWDCQNQHQAQEAYSVWLRQVIPEMKAYFDPLIKAIADWHDNIYAYFDHPIIKAYTNSLNNLLRVVNRMGRGYSFEALCAN